MSHILLERLKSDKIPFIKSEWEREREKSTKKCTKMHKLFIHCVLKSLILVKWRKIRHTKKKSREETKIGKCRDNEYFSFKRWIFIYITLLYIFNFRFIWAELTIFFCYSFCYSVSSMGNFALQMQRQYHIVGNNWRQHFSFADRFGNVICPWIHLFFFRSLKW